MRGPYDDARQLQRRRFRPTHQRSAARLHRRHAELLAFSGLADRFPASRGLAVCASLALGYRCFARADGMGAALARAAVGLAPAVLPAGHETGGELAPAGRAALAWLVGMRHLGTAPTLRALIPAGAGGITALVVRAGRARRRHRLPATARTSFKAGARACASGVCR